MPERLILETVEQVYHTLEEHAVFAPGEKAVVAVSGGVDSLVLLDVMERLQPRLNIHLHVAHLDHQLRPESGVDRQFVLAVARQRGLPCTGECRDVAGHAHQHRLSIEAAARQVRYQFLDEVARQVGAGKILLGHQAGDQAETVLLRLVRGSGAGGLGAMALVRGGRYVRPLLGMKRQTIEAYAAAADLEFRVDSSNRERCFARNRIRHELIPHLQTYNPHIVEALNRTAQILKPEDEYLDEVASRALAVANRREAFPGCGREPVILDLEALLDCHLAVQRRMIRKLLHRLSGREGPFAFEHVEKALEVARQPQGGMAQIVYGLGVQRVGRFFILGRVKPSPVDEELSLPGELEIEESGISLRLELLAVSCMAALRPKLGGLRAAFDAQLAGPCLRLRRPQQGDRFQPLGMTGCKKLSDFLVDLKWPRLLRQELLLLTRPDGEIVWVIGLRLAHPFRVLSATRQIGLVEVTCLQDEP